MKLRERMARWIDSILQIAPIARIRYDAQLLLGVKRLVGWRRLFPVMEQLGITRGAINARYGNVVGNLVLAMTGSLNGCRYCGVGHLYAANVYYFESTGRLFPIDELRTHELQSMPFEALNDYFQESLSDSEFAETRRVLQRVFRLRMGHLPEDDEDRELQRGIDVWDFVNECTIPFGYDVKLENFGPALSDPVPLNVIRRYRAARAKERTEN